MGLGHSNMW